MAPDNTMARRGKPIDRWLGLASVVAGIVFYLIPKTPSVVVFSLALIFALLIHPIWHFWWIEVKLWRKLLATALLVLALFALGQISWPPESGSFLQATTRVWDVSWRWLFGLQGRWFDRFVGAVCVILGALLLVVLKQFVRTRRPSGTGIKGFLDYKLDTENAMLALPAILGKLTAITDDVAKSMDKHTNALQRASSTSQQLKISKVASSSLDRYSVKANRVQVKYVAVGRLLSEGLSGWSKWIEESRPSKSSFADFPNAMRQFNAGLKGSNDALHLYITTLRQGKGASRVLDAAIDRHIHHLQLILDTNLNIHAACIESLKIIDGLAD
jgi:hypothetical protein